MSGKYYFFQKKFMSELKFSNLWIMLSQLDHKLTHFNFVNHIDMIERKFQKVLNDSNRGLNDSRVSKR